MFHANRAVATISLLLVLIALAAPAEVTAQTLAAGQHLGLQSLLTDFVAQGITLAPPASGINHSAHFTARQSPQFRALNRVNEELGREISSVPLSSSAGGFAYEFDPSLGTFSRPTRSFGPIYADRPLTVGKGKFNVGINFSSYSFDRMDDLRLRDGDIQLVFTHQDTDSSGDSETTYFEGDLVVSNLSLSIKTDVTSLVATYGVTPSLDVGLAVPIVSVDMQASSTATILRLSTGEESDVHVFPNGTDHQTFGRAGTASGLGDIVMSAKVRLPEKTQVLLGASAELRFPTGDQDNLLGTGAFRATGRLLASYNHPSISPHASIGYAKTGQGLPSEVLYTAGVDAAADPKMTLVLDFLGRWSNDLTKVYLGNETYTYNTAPSGTPDLHQATYDRLNYSEKQSVNSIRGAIGVKINMYGNLLLNLSGLFPVTKTGLRDEFTPYIGFDYSF